MKTQTISSLILSLCLFITPTLRAEVPGILTYQGSLAVDRAPYTGTAYLKFSIADITGTTNIWIHDGSFTEEPGNSITTSVSNGLFTVNLGDTNVPNMAAPIPSLAFANMPLYLRIWVSTNDTDFQLLTPFTRLTAAPFALDAGVAQTVPNASITAVKLAPGAISGTASLSLDGNNLQLNDAGGSTSVSLASLTSPNSWKLDGNNVSNGQFIGSTNDMPLEFRANNSRVLRMDPYRTAGPVAGNNILAGAPQNAVGSNVLGATIAGGGGSLLGTSKSNFVSGTFGTVGGGAGNFAGGGSVVGGGVDNISDGSSTTISGGLGNTNSGFGSVIGGGFANRISTNSGYSTIGGGLENSASGDYSTVPGGWGNLASGTGTFAAGRGARAVHHGSFVWNDSSFSFESTNPNQFLIHAAGGVGIGLNTPATALHVNGTVTASAFAGNGSLLTGLSAANFSSLAASDGSPAKALAIDVDGNVGVGIETPASALHVVGTVTATAFTGNGSGLTNISTLSAADGSPAVALLVDNGGRVGIGTTSPTSDLTVGAGTNSTVITINGTNNAYAGLNLQASGAEKWFVGFANNNAFTIRRNSGEDAVVINNSTGNVGLGRLPLANRLEVNGDASKTTTGGWFANSDQRIKTEIATVTDALQTLNKVRLVSFRYTDDYRAAHPASIDRTYHNVIAQEFKEIFPDYVKNSGEKLPNGDEILQVDTYPLTIYSVAAIQELKREKDTEIQQLKSENADLKKRLEALEKLAMSLVGDSPLEHQPITQNNLKSAIAR